MNRNQQILWVVLTAGFGAVGGWMAGRSGRGTEVAADSTLHRSGSALMEGVGSMNPRVPGTNSVLFPSPADLTWDGLFERCTGPRMSGRTDFEIVFLARAMAERTPVSEFRELLLRTKKNLGEEASEMIRLGIESEWVRRDPGGFLDESVLNRNDNEFFHSELREMAIRRLATLDPARAEKWLESVKPRAGFNKEVVGLEILAASAKDHPDKWLEFARTPVTSDEARQKQRGLIQEGYHALAAKDPVQLMSLVEQSGIAPEHSVISTALSSWRGDDTAGAVQWLQGLSGKKMLPTTVAEAVTHLAGSKPELALQIWEKLESRPSRDNQLRIILDKYGESDPARLKDWAATRSDARERSTAMSLYAGRLAETQPEAAARLLGEMSVPGDRRMAVAAISMKWAEKDPASAWAWLRQDGFSEHADDRAGLLARWVQRDPESALAAARGLPENQRTEGWKQVAASLATEHSGRFAEAFAEFLADPGFKKDSPAMIQHWAAKDPAAASQWLETAQDPELRTKFIESFVSGANGTDIRLAWAWAFQLPVDKDNSRAADVAARWLREDFEAARRAIESSPLSDEIKRKLLESGLE